ncbi:hypothetical protein Tco_0544051 [Tanacetum coccineum]
MEFEYANSSTTIKLPILKLVQENGTSVTKMHVPVTAKEKTNKKNDVKAISLLLMALPNEHQLTFSQYPDAKSMLQKIMNKVEDYTMSINDLYNNFKIVEQKVKKSVGASSGAQNLAFMTAPSTSSTNDVNTASPEASIASINVYIASSQVSTASFSNNAAYAFMVKNLNGSNLLHQYLEKIHEDDLEAIDFEVATLFAKYEGKEMRHFARECRAPRSKEGQFRNQDNTRKQGNNEDTSSKAMLAIDGVGFDWSDMAEEQVHTNMALMSFSDSKFEKVKQEKEGIEFKIKNFDKASKDLDQLLGSQITDKSKKGLGYSAVPPPHPLIYNRPKQLDLSYSGLDEFKEPEFKGYGTENSKQKSNIVCDKKSDDSKKSSNDSLVKDQVSKDTSSFVESSLNVNKETVFPVDKKAQCKYHQREGMVYGNTYKRVNYNYTHPNAQRNMVPRAVLMKTGLKTFNTARTVNTAHPKSIVFSAKPNSCFSKTAQSTIRRRFQTKTSLTNKRFTHNVNTAKAQAVNTARPKTVKTARPNTIVVNAVRVNQANVVKASAC